MRRCGIGGTGSVRCSPADIRRQRVSRMRGFRHWRWHLDEMYVKLNGEMVYLWRAVDQEGEILESYITKTRDKARLYLHEEGAEAPRLSPRRSPPTGCAPTAPR